MKCARCKKNESELTFCESELAYAHGFTEEICKPCFAKMNTENLMCSVKNWRKNHNDLRFGQWLWNLMAKNGLWQSPEGNVLFYIEDGELAKLIENDNK